MSYIFIAEILTNYFQSQVQSVASTWAAIISLVIAIILIITLIVFIIVILKSVALLKSTQSPVKPSDSLSGKKNDTAPVNILQSTNKDDLTIVAVITAAIAAMLSSDSSRNSTYPGFKVRKIRRVK
jgi:hypothetical protein